MIVGTASSYRAPVMFLGLCDPPRRRRVRGLMGVAAGEVAYYPRSTRTLTKGGAPLRGTEGEVFFARYVPGASLGPVATPPGSPATTSRPEGERGGRRRPRAFGALMRAELRPRGRVEGVRSAALEPFRAEGLHTASTCDDSRDDYGRACSSPRRAR